MSNLIKNIDLEKEIINFNYLEYKRLEKKRDNTFFHKLYGFFKGLKYSGVENWKVRADFKNLNKEGYHNLISDLIKNPIFSYEGNFHESKNHDYWKFLVSKQNNFDEIFYRFFD